jgi:hypothetical protein
MQRRGGVVAVLTCLAMSAAGCGATDVTPNASPVGSPTSEGPPTPSSTSPASDEAAILQPDGIGEVHFGDPIADALAWFEERFGSPDEIRSAHDPDLWGYLSDGPDLDGRIRIVTWDQLQVVFLDRSGTVAPDALPFAAWTLGWGEGEGPALVTPQGIGLGSTLANLERAYGDALTVPEEPGGPCAISWVFAVGAPPGPFQGTFGEQPQTSDAEVATIGAGAVPSC